MNNFIKLGLLFNALFLLGNHIVLFPDFLQGLSLGLAIVFFTLGVYAQHRDLSTLTNFKKRLFTKLFLK